MEPVKSEKLKFIDLAREYLGPENKNQSINFDDLYKGLIKYDQFGYATEILLLKIETQKEPDETVLLKQYQQLAKNIYKDTTLSGYFKYDKALSVLKQYCSLETTNNTETLGLAGAINKYYWKFDHQFSHLLLSRSFYKKGYLIWKKNPTQSDNGYNAINYAYLNELITVQNLEQLNEVEGITDGMLKRFALSQEVRQEIIAAFVSPKNNKVLTIEGDEWLYATLAEAYFGIRQYESASYYVSRYIETNPEAWQIRTFAQQLYHIAYFQEIEKKHSPLFNAADISEDGQKACLYLLESLAENEDEAKEDFVKYKNEDAKPFEEVYGEIEFTTTDTDTFSQSKKDSEAFDQKKEGKVGIGMSGGGFRAALYHIGVLAALAEQDKLKDIEVFSCVSGGSILGTYYYLHVKHLLETVPDNQITKQHYIKIVKKIETTFQAAVENNLRMEVLTNLEKNLKMLLSQEYSRSHRLGELYEKYFYLPLYNSLYNKEVKELHMKHLYIKPIGLAKFDIYNDNWKRNNKVPQLILNATSLNTGHNWQFTASWMGEPPTFISGDLDVKPRLRRMYYEKAPQDRYRNFRLGYAVAASSCVPVLFEPLKLTDLYPGYELQLVDGGVHDNQGIASILEQECSSIIISDGSAQMTNDAKAVPNELALYFRVDSILQERVREIQLLDIKYRKYNGNLRQLHVMHLKKELTSPAIPWIGCNEPERKVYGTAQNGPWMNFGLLRNIQDLISKIRTDLDSHNQLESYALMYSGYQHTLYEYEVLTQSTPQNWCFGPIVPHCRNQNTPNQEFFEKQLKVSSAVPFKIVKLYTPLENFLIFIGIISLEIAAIFILINLESLQKPISITLTNTISIIVIITLTIAGLSKFLKYTDLKGWLRKKIFLVGFVVFGCIVFNLYQMSLNKLYNKLGRLP